MVGLPPVLQARSDAQATRFGEIDRIGWAAECLDNDDDASIRKILPPWVVRLKEKTEEALADQPLVLQTKESILREEVRDLVESPLADETEERCSLKPNGDNSKHSAFNSKHGARSISSRFSQDAISTSVSSKQSLPSMYSAPVAQDEQSISGHMNHRDSDTSTKRVSDKSDASTVSSKCTVKSKLNTLSNSSKQATSDSNVSIKQDHDQQDATLQSKSTVGEDSYVPKRTRSNGSCGSRRNNPNEWESFLDILIDSLCSDSNNACRDTFRRADDDYSSDDESFGMEEDETYEKTYKDDGTLEMVETREHPAEALLPSPETLVPPLGLAPNPPRRAMEVEYNDRFDHGVDVSVMESLRRPSLLIEKQQIVPPNILDKYGLDFCLPGMTRAQSVSAEPLRYYTHVVKQLLEQHEPEKLLMLDKLLAKYKGCEDHLVQKFAVRYSKDDNNSNNNNEAVKRNKQSVMAKTAVHAAKEQLHQSAAATHTANHHHHPHHHLEDDNEDDYHEHNVKVSNDWPAKVTKEGEDGDEDTSESGLDYSRDETSPAVIVQVSELLNYMYGKTSVRGQIDRVSTIMRAYKGREAVLLELLETRALIKANKEKENADTLPSFLQNSQLTQAQKNASEGNNGTFAANGMAPVTPMATNPEQGDTVIDDEISSMSGVSSPATVEVTAPVEAPPSTSYNNKASESSPMNGVAAKTNSSSSSGVLKPPPTPHKRKKGMFGGLFGKKNKKAAGTSISSGCSARPGSRLRPGRNKVKAVLSVERSI